MADNVFSEITESGNYQEISSQSGLSELINEVNNKQAQLGGKRRGRKSAAAKKTSKKASKKTSRKGSKKQSGGKKRASKKTSKKTSRKASKKASKKQSGGKKRSSKKTSRKASKKTSRKGSRKASKPELLIAVAKGNKKSSKKMSKKGGKKGSRKGSGGPKRELPPAIKRWQALVKVVVDDADVPVKYNEAIAVAKIYKDEMMKTHKLESLDSINKAIKEYPNESTAAKKKYVSKAQSNMADRKSAKKANK